MRIRTLQLRNYRRYRSADLELPDGLVSIIGPNGSGKSTLMEAVAWVLFGNQSEIVRTGKESIKRQDAGPKEHCSVTMEFDFEDTGYIVERTMKGKSLAMNAELRAGGSIVARGSEDVSRRLAELFGMDHKSFFISVFARQKELNALTSQPKGERKKMVLRLLDIESIDLAIKQIREDKRFARDSISVARRQLVDEQGGSAIEALEEEIEGIRTGTKELEASRENVIEELEKVESVHSKLREQIDGQEKKAREKEKLESSLKSLRTRLESLGERKEEMDADLEQMAQLEEKHKELEPKARKRQRDLEAIDAKENDAREEMDRFRDRLAEARARSKQAAAEIDRFKSEISGIEELGPDSDCPTCERRLGDTYQALIDKYGGLIDEKEKTISWLEDEMSEAKDGQKEVKARLEALSRQRERLMGKLREFEALEVKVKGAAKLRERRDKLSARMEAAVNDIEQHESELEKIEFDQESYDRARKAFVDMNAELRKLDKQKHEVVSEIMRLEERLGAREKELSGLREIEESFQEKEQRAVNLAALEEIMNDFKKHLISRIRPALSGMSSDLLSVLTEGRYNEMSLDEDYEISIRDGGELHELDRFSGGEKDLANLCLRLAISDIIATRYGTNSFDMIVLDEIFGSQDSGRKRTLLTTLNGLSNRFKQIFLITHVEDVKELMGNVIQVSEGQGGTSIAEVAD